MSQMQFMIWQAIKEIGEGVWFSAPVIAKRSGCQTITAKRHLDALVKDGYLNTEKALYNNHLPQSLYQMPVEKDGQ